MQLQSLRTISGFKSTTNWMVSVVRFNNRVGVCAVGLKNTSVKGRLISGNDITCQIVLCCLSINKKTLITNTCAWFKILGLQTLFLTPQILFLLTHPGKTPTFPSNPLASRFLCAPRSVTPPLPVVIPGPSRFMGWGLRAVRATRQIARNKWRWATPRVRWPCVASRALRRRVVNLSRAQHRPYVAYSLPCQCHGSPLNLR